MKYIIELENRNYVNGSSCKDDILYRVKGFRSLVFDQNGLDKLTPYDQDEAYQRGFDDAHKISIEECQRSYERGIAEAWDFARHLNAVSPNITDNIYLSANGGKGMDVALEMTYGPELPYMLLSKIVNNFPNLEKPAYLMVKLSGYESGTVYEYLKHFANTKSDPNNVPWAESFLDNCLDYQTVDAADLFRSYVHNKIRKEKQSHYLDMIDQLVKEYTAKSNQPDSTKWLMMLYMISSVVNIILLPIMMMLSGWLAPIFDFYYGINIILSITVVSVEVLLVFLHHKIYGNRLNISRTERLWMVIFMSTMVFAVGSVVMGSIWKITF